MSFKNTWSLINSGLYLTDDPLLFLKIKNPNLNLELIGVLVFFANT